MNDKYDLTNTGAQVQEAITSSLEVFPTQISSLEANKVAKVSGKGLSTNDYSNDDKNKVAKLVINGTGSLFLANDGSYKSASEVINYNEIDNKPLLNTNNDNSLEVSENETIVNTISLHRIAKTGSYSDLQDVPVIPTITLNGTATTSPNFYSPTTIGTEGQYLVTKNNLPTWQNLPVIPTIKLNNSTTTSPSFYAPISGGTQDYYLKSNGSAAPTWQQFPTIPTITLNGNITNTPSFYAPITQGTQDYYLKSNGDNIPTWEQFPTIPTIGVLNTSSTTSLSPAISESFTSNITLHKISKTGSYNDLLDAPILSYTGTQANPIVLSDLANGTSFVLGYYKNNASDSTVYQTNSSMLINKDNNNISILNGARTQVNYNTLTGTTWTTKITNLVQANSFDSIEVVNEYPSTMKDNVLYMKVEAI